MTVGRTSLDQLCRPLAAEHRRTDALLAAIGPDVSVNDPPAPKPAAAPNHDAAKAFARSVVRREGWVHPKRVRRS